MPRHIHMERRFQAITLLTLLAAAAVLGAQVRVDVRLVNVVATVTDARGRGIANLTADDFILEEDGKPQEITHFSQDQNVPVSVGILLDTSGSMDRKIRTAVEAVERFSRRIQQKDEIFLITFSGRPVLRQDFTDDRDKLSQALRRVNATGGTALYDALSEGLAKIRSGRHNKRAILLITDGQDTASETKIDDVLQSIRESDLLIYPIGISGLTYAKGSDVFGAGALSALLPGKPTRAVQSKRDEVDLNVVRALAENSGGRAFLLAESLINRGGQIEKVLDTIGDELRSQYTLGFYPSRPDDGRYHSLRVRTRSGNAVRARRGYVATAS
jgi:Ca-activated chloride channel family protein